MLPEISRPVPIFDQLPKNVDGTNFPEKNNHFNFRTKTVLCIDNRTLMPPTFFLDFSPVKIELAL